GRGRGRPLRRRAVGVTGEVMARAAPSGARRALKHRQIELLFAGDLAELVLGARLDLSDPLLGDAQLAAELLPGLLADAAKSEAADDDLPLALVEPAEHPLDRLLHSLERAFILMLVGAVVGGGLEHFFVAGDEAVAAVVLLGDSPREVFHNGPRCVSA